MNRLRRLLALALAGMPGAVLAATVPASASSAADATPGMGGELVRVVLSLVAVVAVILLAGWLGRRAQGRVRPGGRRVRCLESLVVGAKDRVLLLEAGGRQLLVGVSPGGMRTLLVLDADADADTDEQAPPPAPAGGFRDLLAQWRQRP